MNLPFEASGKWSVKHGQDFMADIVNTRAMDFNRAGFATLSKKPCVLYTKDTAANFRTVMAIVPLSTGTSTTYYFVTSGRCYSWDASTTALTELTTTSMATLGLDSDGVIFNGVLHVSGGDAITSWGGSSWTSRVTGLSNSYPHPLCTSDFQPYLAVGKQNTVLLYDISYSNVLTCTLPANYIVTGIRARAGNYYIATRAIDGNSARLFVWNGSGTVAQSQWDVRADWIYSLVDFQSSIVVLTSAGQLLRFNGGGFEQLAAFPIYYTPYSWTTSSALSNGTGRCANRGMIAHGDILYININGGINTSLTDGVGRFLHNQPSGLWVYDPQTGTSNTAGTANSGGNLYHKGGYCYTKFNASTYTLASNTLTLPATHNLQTGDPVYPTDVTGVTGLVVSQLYFAVVISSTTIKLAMSRADALAGRTLTLTGTPSGATIIIDTFDSVGATYTQVVPGAVGLFQTDNPPSILGSEVMYAGDVTKTDMTSISTLMSFGASHGVGSFTTTPLPASQVTDTYQKLFTYIHNLYLTDAKVLIKYRTGPRYGFPTQYRKDNSGVALWVDASTFTIDTAYKDFKGVAVGDEIEIIEGAGAGYTAHISSIDGAGPYRIGIDEVIPGITVGMKSEVIADNWTKIATIDSTNTNIVNQFAEVPVGDADTYIQFKVELRGIGVAVRKMQSVAIPLKKVV